MPTPPARRRRRPARAAAPAPPENPPVREMRRAKPAAKRTGRRRFPVSLWVLGCAILFLLGSLAATAEEIRYMTAGVPGLGRLTEIGPPVFTPGRRERPKYYEFATFVVLEGPSEGEEVTRRRVDFLALRGENGFPLEEGDAVELRSIAGAAGTTRLAASADYGGFVIAGVAAVCVLAAVVICAVESLMTPGAESISTEEHRGY